MSDLAPGEGICGDLFVVELGDEGTQAAAKMFADMGATVVKVEPPQGSAARHRGPYLHGHEGDVNASLFFWAYNTSKQSIRLDLDVEADRAALLRLLERADVLIEDQPVGYLAERGLGYGDLSARFPSLVHVSVTPFGSEGPLSTWKGSDLVCWAMGGAMILVGYQDHSTLPLAPQGDLVGQLVAQWAVIGALAAIQQRLVDGLGQHVDVSMQEAIAFTVGPYASATFEYPFDFVERPDLWHKVYVAFDDRYLVAQMLNITPDQWQTFKDWMAGQGTDAKIADIPAAVLGDAANRPTLLAAIGDLGTKYPTAELCKIGQEFGFTWMAVNSAEELFVDEQLRARGFFRPVEHAELGQSFEYPGPGPEFSDGAWQIRRRPPLLGEDDEAWGALRT